jgi:small-conductance mechanosensitive channel
VLTVLTEQAQQTADTAASQQAVQAALLERIADALEALALAPAAEPPQPLEQHVCETCAATREQLVDLARRVADLESAP